MCPHRFLRLPRDGAGGPAAPAAAWVRRTLGGAVLSGEEIERCLIEVDLLGVMLVEQADARTAGTLDSPRCRVELPQHEPV